MDLPSASCQLNNARNFAADDKQQRVFRRDDENENVVRSTKERGMKARRFKGLFRD